MLWVDKYRPKTLAQLTYHKRLTLMLEKMVISGNFPHLLFYGPPGAGKKTRILALLNAVFGRGVRKIKTDHRSFKVNSRTIEITTLSSNYHIEMNPSDAGIYDRVVVQDIIKEIASTTSLSVSMYAKAALPQNNNNNNNSNHSQNDDGGGRKNVNFKVVILNEVDRLTKDAQHGLRRTMEKYMNQCRLILQCNSVSKVIEPLRSRCLSIRIPAPSHSEICGVLNTIAYKERITLQPQFCQAIAVKSNRNLRRAMLMLQVCAMDTDELTLGDEATLNNNNQNNNNQHNRNKNSSKIKRAAWELFIEEIARLIVEEQSPQRLLLIRSKFYELLSNCIPEDVIFEKLTVALMNNCDNSLRYEIAKWSAYHEHRMQLGAKPIIHLEAFCAKVMSIYKKWALSYF